MNDLPNILAFGPLFPGEPDYAHQAHEFMSLDHWLECATIYARAIAELAGED